MAKKKEDNQNSSSDDHHIHDKGYKLLLSYWEIFKQLIEGYVEENWKENLDFPNSKTLRTDFIGRELEKRESDILYEVPLLGTKEKIFLYVLIENQSSVDYLMAFRVLRYLTDIWTKICKNTKKEVREKKSFRLPPVYPIVLYNGSPSWTAEISVRKLVQEKGLFPKGIPDVEYHLVDIPRLTLEKLKQTENVLASVFTLEHDLDTQDFNEAFQKAIETAYKEENDAIWRAFVEWIRVFVKRSYPDNAPLLIKKIDATKHSKEEVKTMLETMPTKLFKAEKEKGIAEGLKKGREEKAKEIALKLLEDKVEISTICRATSLSEEEITKLKKEHNL